MVITLNSPPSYPDKNISVFFFSAYVEILSHGWVLKFK